MELELKKLTKAFGKKTLFRDFSYIFDSIGIYAVTGASGVGKTPLLRIIAGLEKDFEGEVSGGGTKNVSICFQEHLMLKPTKSVFMEINGQFTPFLHFIFPMKWSGGAVPHNI